MPGSGAALVLFNLSERNIYAHVNYQMAIIYMAAKFSTSRVSDHKKAYKYNINVTIILIYNVVYTHYIIISITNI
jgi:hypothetical protein